eukprot:2923353-Rhodomonas_salina.1
MDREHAKCFLLNNPLHSLSLISVVVPGKQNTTSSPKQKQNSHGINGSKIATQQVLRGGRAGRGCKMP